MKKQKLFSAKEIREMLIKLDPSIIDEKLTNPFIYQNVKKLYKNLEKYI